MSGPSKDARVPLLVGATNTGKSTLVESFDALYGHKHVFHLPSVTDGKFGLRSWMRDKRFVLWDEFSPVEFAHEKVFSVTTFKKAFGGQCFEIQMPQNWHDGNQDFRWQQGVVFTNMEEDLWTPTENVKAEDIRHLQSLVEMFRFAHQLCRPGSRSSRGSIPQCRHHLAIWIRDDSAAFDASQALQPSLGDVAVASPGAQDANARGHSGGTVTHLEDFMDRVQLPQATREAIT